MNILSLNSSAVKATKLMKALSSENRLMILCLLSDGEKSVGQLATATGLRSASVSQQLALLRKDAFVTYRRDAQTLYYSLDGEDAKRIMQTLFELYC